MAEINSRQPFKKELNGFYIPSQQIFTPIGSKENLYYLVGYDFEARASKRKSIISILPLVLNFDDKLPSYPEQWSKDDITKVVEKVFKWQNKPNSTPEKQFYKKFISPTRKNKYMVPRFEQVSLPLTTEFYTATAVIRAVVNGRLSLVYRYIQEEEEHLADALLLVSTTELSTGRVVDEAITTFFISDEDTILISPNCPGLGKITLSVPLDSPYNLAGFNASPLAHFKRKTVEYEGVDIVTDQVLALEEKVDYRGDCALAVRTFLENIRTANSHHNNGRKEYIVYQNNKNVKTIDYAEKKKSTHTYATSVYGVGEAVVEHKSVITFPNYTSNIIKAFCPRFHADNCYTLSESILETIGIKDSE